jgi:hypothetical protein
MGYFIYQSLNKVLNHADNKENYFSTCIFFYRITIYSNLWLSKKSVALNYNWY